MITDANYKDGIVNDASFTMSDVIYELVRQNIVTSVVTGTSYYSTYNALVTGTDGIYANITQNFAVALEPLISKMNDQVNNGCWVRLSNGSVVCLDKDPTLEDASVDTDGDGIDDNEDLNPTVYDTLPIYVDAGMITFNTGRTWYIDDYTAEEIWDAQKRLEEAEYNTNRNTGDAKEILQGAAEIINHNDLQPFTIEELIFIALTDGDGIRFYLDSKLISTRECLFEKVYGRKTEYLQKKANSHIENSDTGLSIKGWSKVSGYEANGWFKGEVLSEADIVYSFDQLRVRDINSVIALTKVLGLILISSIVTVYAGYYVTVNIQALSYYIQSNGIKAGIQYYLTLGAASAPTLDNSVMGILSREFADGDDDEYRVIDLADEVIITDKDGWALAPIVRGNYYDDVMGNNLGHNFPVVDKIENRVITSIKSMDIRLKSYQSADGIYNRIVKDASTLSKFTGKTWAGMSIKARDFDSKVLQLILPNATLTAEQMLGLQAAEIYINNELNIKLLLTVATQ